MKTFKEKIKLKYTELTPSLKKVAHYMLKNPNQVAVDSAEQIGGKIGVSETTIIRFTYALGYKGYSDFQRELREYYFSKKSSLDSYQRDKLSIDKHQFYQRLVLKDQNNIFNAAKLINEEDFHQAVKKILTADKILILGQRIAFSMAHWLTFSLDLIKGDVRFIQPSTDDLILRASEITEKSVFIVFSFHRYVASTLSFTKEMKKRNAFVISFTDSELAPITEHADIVFSVQQELKSPLDATPIVFSLMNALVAGLMLEDPVQFKNRKDIYDANQLKDFFLLEGEYE